MSLLFYGYIHKRIYIYIHVPLHEDMWGVSVQGFGGFQSFGLSGFWVWGGRASALGFGA